MNWYASLINYLVSLFMQPSQNTTVLQVQRLTVQFCKYEPEAESVALMLSAANPTVVGAVAVAKAICAAVSPTTVQMGLASFESSPDDKATVNGVPIQGHFVD